MLALKPGVKIDYLQPQMLIAVIVANDVYRELGGSCTITSGNDGKHMTNSRHYKGLAIDLRTRDLLPSNRAVVLQRLRQRLGADFDVVFEEDHVHIEFDPKGV